MTSGGVRNVPLKGPCSPPAAHLTIGLRSNLIEVLRGTTQTFGPLGNLPLGRFFGGNKWPSIWSFHPNHFGDFQVPHVWSAGGASTFLGQHQRASTEGSVGGCALPAWPIRGSDPPDVLWPGYKKVTGKPWGNMSDLCETGKIGDNLGGSLILRAAGGICRSYTLLRLAPVVLKVFNKNCESTSNDATCGLEFSTTRTSLATIDAHTTCIYMV